LGISKPETSDLLSVCGSEKFGLPENDLPETLEFAVERTSVITHITREYIKYRPNINSFNKSRPPGFEPRSNALGLNLF
jgi:hypothetical protein